MYPSAPPLYQADAPEYRQTMPNHHTTSEERMADFQQLVNRYESKFVI
jgi:hypothetical protein